MIISSPDETILHASSWPDMSSEEIVDYLIKHNIDLFFPTDTKEKSNKSFKKLFLYNPTLNVSDRKIWNKNLYRHESRRGPVFGKSKFSNASSNHYLEYYRLRAVNRLTGVSPVESYYDIDKCARIIKHLLNNHPNDQPITSRIIRKYINTIFPEVPQFPPVLAKYIINRFCVKGGSVLDVNCEWGDRLAGFYASDAGDYTGIFNCPPNLAALSPLVVKYMDMIENLADLSNDEKDVNLLFNEQRQRFTSSKSLKKFNLLFTSLNSEYEIPKVLYNILNPKFLHNKGYIVVHLEDFKFNGKKANLIQSLINTMNRHPQLTRIPPLGLENTFPSGNNPSGNNPSGNNPSGNKSWIEPIWVWRKT